MLAVPLGDDRWTACQVVAVDDGGPVALSLQWLGDVRPTLDDVRDAPPLRVDHHAWDGDLAWRHVTPAPPSTFVPLGALPVPPGLGACNAHGSWDGVGGEIGGQARWLALPAAARAAYKAAHRRRDDVTLDLGALTVTARADRARLHVDAAALPPGTALRWAGLDDLGCLTELDYDGDDPGVIGHLRARPMIAELSWSAHGQATIDLRELTITTFATTLAAPLTLHLPPSVTTLRVRGDARHLTCHQAGDGRRLELWVGPDDDGRLALPAGGLARLDALHVWGARRVDAAAIATWTALTRLHVHGDAVTLDGVERLAALTALRRLELIHCYGLDAAAFPAAATAWPALTSASIDGHRKADAAALRARLAGVASVELRGGKTDAWLSANLDNPFRDWVDRAAAVGRAAAAAWRTACAALDGARSRRTTEAALRALVDAFNRLGDRHGLDTVDREEVGEAFLTLSRRAGIDDATSGAWFDAWREF
ncbi:MAG: hypothetical protein H6709_19950 [Kofleriaceae bacterium]|nr:hypothetical protein [Kofleriaceae bacterium]